MTQVMFETFNAPATYIAAQPVLALYASGRTAGMVLHSGEGSTVAFPVHEGFAISNAIRRLDIAGHEVTQQLRKQLVEAGYELGNAADLEPVRRMKEKLCFLSVPEAPAEERQPTTYVLPDGYRVELDSKMMQSPEVLFDPSLVRMDCGGVDQMIQESLSECDIHVRKALSQAVLLSGGTTLLPGFKERVQYHLEKGLNEEYVPKVLAPEERTLSTWIGGSILGSLPNFRQMWISGDDYHDKGPRIVHEKCFSDSVNSSE